ncbi:MAG TPA: acetyl-CoA carboxylase biotin carboxyl carrier protein [Verrucomicrobiae bacterium]|nr:acetyl-CoA carboxylase biotin carboxyl carrier protein [Verrucomicrobiae bacterium]
MDLKDIKAIIDLMKKNSLSEFELERADFKIKLKRGASGMVEENHASGYQQTLALPQALPPNAAAQVAVAAGPAASAEADISSPMIGTFYRAPSPESANYVDIGSEVNADTVVCLIEAMKVMNEIKAETKGVITQILVENAKPVEFGQPMFKIRPL